MRKYTQITVVISVLFFLVWLRDVTFRADDTSTTGVKKNNPISSVSISVSPTLALTPTPTSKPINPTKTTTSARNVPTIVPTDSVAPSTPTPAPAQTGQYKNGIYTGSVADAFYGNVQVQVIISGGQITDVIFLQYPDHNNTSININSQAMPLLKQEALQAQSANISGVSGASATSPAFQSSLADALSQAKN
jgi:uncharacterized protein with FMN-binding domain